MFLMMLKANVDIVTKSGWPANATRPKPEPDIDIAEGNDAAPADKTASQPIGNDAPSDQQDTSNDSP
jgi:hypothetical protein